MSSPFSQKFQANNPLRKKSKEAKPQEKVEQKPLYSEADWHKVASVTDAAIKKGAGAYIEVPNPNKNKQESEGSVAKMSPLNGAYENAADTQGGAVYIPMAGVVTDALSRLGDGLETTVNKIQRRKDFEQAKNKDNPYYTEEDFEKSWGDYSFKNQATASADNNDMNSLFDKLLKNIQSNNVTPTNEEPKKEEKKESPGNMLSPLNETFEEEFNRLESTKGKGKSMMQGQSLDEVTVTTTKKKTRAEHRRDKTKKKIEDNKDDASKRKKNDRLTRRKARLERKVKRQENKDKKKYAKKQGKIKRGK
tara:strand:- start:1456 stop:2373 length:918 start_codon:yes stop_codon:yes gene_type:complete